MNELKRLYQRFHEGRPDKVIEAACMTVGLPLKYIHKIIEKRSGYFEDINSITVNDWFYICDLLKVDIDSLQYGYSPYIHQRRIGDAVYEGNYQLPITKKVEIIWETHKTERHKERKNELKNYGGRLKRKIFLKNLKTDFQYFFVRMNKKVIKTNYKHEQEFLT